MEASSEILIIAEAFPERNAPLHGGPARRPSHREVRRPRDDRGLNARPDWDRRKGSPPSTGPPLTAACCLSGLDILQGLAPHSDPASRVARSTPWGFPQ